MNKTGSNNSKVQHQASGPPILKNLVKKLEELPTLPVAAAQAIMLSLEDEADIEKIAHLVESDPALTIKVLKLLNRPSRLTSQKIQRVQQAISLIGLTALRCSLLGVITQDLLVPNSEHLLAIQKKIWCHSLVCAVASQLIAKHTFPELKELAFMSGILHDLGKAALLTIDPQSFNYWNFETEQITLSEEQQKWGCTHIQIGKWLAEKWKLPQEIINVIFFHHQPPQALQFINIERELIHIVMLGNHLAHDYLFDQNFNKNFFKTTQQIKAILDLTDKEVENIKEQIPELYLERAHLFELPDEPQKFFQPLLEKANQKLSKISLYLEEERTQLNLLTRLNSTVNQLSLDLSQAKTVDMVFKIVASNLRQLESFYAGVVYVVDAENRILEGNIWISSQKNRKLSCFLDKEALPIWDNQTHFFPQGLKEILSTYKYRINDLSLSKQKKNILYKHPFYIMALNSTTHNIRGELCLAPKEQNQDLSTAEATFLEQVTRQIVATLEKLSIQESLEVRNEELALALWQNQQMNNDLLQTERLAAVGQLAAGAAHEINNPLAIINARAQLMQLKETDPKKQENLKQITEQIERISEILKNLMEFARPAPPKCEPIVITDILNKIIKLTQPSFAKNKIEIKKFYDPNLPLIKADPKQLEQVFLNLFINAQHAMEEKGGVLTVKTFLGQDGNSVFIEIIDQGTGIAQKDLEKIFDPFFTTKEPGKGTGLGLSTSVSIIENHFGKLNIKSKEGHGTVVSIQLPIQIDNLKTTEKFSVQHQERKQPKRPQILVVDDEQHIQDILCETLSAENMEVTTCANGQQALQLLKNAHFDLMLMDMRMPVLDGLSLIRAINDQGIHLPILVITGLATSEEIEEALCKGVSKCIKKPFHIKALLKDIYDLLAQADKIN